MLSADPIAAVREAEATGEVAAVFADLRATLGLPFVNLIWRHLATMPDMLEWVWALTKPIYASGELIDAAETLRKEIVIPDGICQPACVFDVVGVTATDRVMIGQMLRDYSVGNAANLLCLLVTQSILEGRRSDTTASPRSTPARKSAEVDLPGLPGLNELSPEVRALVVALDGFGRFAPTDAVASLYRHLAHWPGFLAIVHAALSVPHHDGRLLAEHGKTRDRARTLAADRLLPLAHVSTPPDSAHRDVAHTSLRAFTEHMIARMLTMGETILALMPTTPDRRT